MSNTFHMIPASEATQLSFSVKLTRAIQEPEKDDNIGSQGVVGK